MYLRPTIYIGSPFNSRAESWGRLQGLVMADIISCFDQIPHAGIIDTLEIYIDDPLLVGLIRNFVQTDPYPYYFIGIGDRLQKKEGYPSPMSPVLMNVFLHEGFDQFLIGEFRDKYFPFVHYLRIVPYRDRL